MVSSLEKSSTSSIIWTRSQDDWSDDMAVFGQALNRVVHVPCIALQPRAEPALGLDLSKVTHVVITSANAARYALADAGIKKLLLSLGALDAVFTHGPVTAAVLQAAGVGVHLVSVRTGEALGRFLGEYLPKSAILLWPSGKDVAYDCSVDLQQRGIQVQRVILYDTKKVMSASDGTALSEIALQQLLARLAAEIAQAGERYDRRPVVCFASPSAARTFILATRAIAPNILRGLIAVVIGPTTAKEVPAGTFNDVIVAASADVKALFNAALAVSQSKNHGQLP